MTSIHLWGVKQNNLKGIDVQIPLKSFTVICGPSGSGKSSLAFETLYAEGQRRYTESLSNYTKQFLNKAPKPDIEGIENIPPSISIEQKNSVKSSRSTVGTTTEVVDYLRLLYEKAAQAFCPDHHCRLEKDSPSSGAQRVLSEFQGDRGYILAPIFEDNRLLKGKDLQKQLLADGYVRVLIPPSPPKKKRALTKKATTKAKKSKAKAKVQKKRSTKKVLTEAQKKSTSTPSEDIKTFAQKKIGEVYDLKDPKFNKLGLPKKTFYIVIDRLMFAPEEQDRVVDSLSQAYWASTKYSSASLTRKATVATTEGKHILISEDHSCPVCDYTIPNISSQLFSFNSPIGACEGCNGFGNILDIDEEKVVPDPGKSIAQGALVPFAMPSAKQDMKTLLAFCRKQKIDPLSPWAQLPQKAQKAIWEGTKDFYGVRGLFEYLETKKYKMHVRVFLARYKSPFVCKACRGTRLKNVTQQILLDNHSISDLSSKTIEELIAFFKQLTLSAEAQEVCKEILRQLHSRLQFLKGVGVGYLTMDRPTRTLSGGEFQRLHLANQLGMGLSQTLYVLDEPTVGLHPRDNARLIEVLKELNDLGNTLVVVEHDHDVIKSSNHVIEMGPGSGHLGGEVIYSGPTPEFYKFKNSNTVKYLMPSKNWAPEITPRPVDFKSYKYTLEIDGCRGNNLKDLTLSFPLNRFVTVTGVSGSGKSSLISNTLYPAIARQLGTEYKQGLPYNTLSGHQYIKNVLFIDQGPIGKTARSSPVTYLKVFDAIRGIFASTTESRQRGYTPGTFSLNVDGGRCPVCKGLGHEVIDMLFMDDIEVPCEACEGLRYREDILEITFKNKNINEVLGMTVEEAMGFFINYPNIRRSLAVLKEVGLEYLSLGQKASSLSGGESQRLKVAREFNSAQQQSTLYILDEPTTGLHFREVHLLLRVLNKLINTGGSVILIEHNLEVIRHSDWVIDIGPEAGAQGGKVVAQGSPKDLMASKKGLTGKYLKEYIDSLNPSLKTSQRKMGKGKNKKNNEKRC